MLEYDPDKRSTSEELFIKFREKFPNQGAKDFTGKSNLSPNMPSGSSTSLDTV